MFPCHKIGIRTLVVLATLLMLAGCASETEHTSEPSAPANIDQSETDLKVYLYKGHSYLDIGNPQMALISLREAQRLAPENGEVLALLGRTYGMLGRYEAALASLKQARELRPDDNDTLFDLAWVLIQLKEFTQAEKALRTVLNDRTFRKRDEATYQLAVIADKQGNQREMVNLLGDVLKINPVHANTHLKLAAFYRSMGRIEQERRHLLEAAAEMADNVDVQEQLADSYWLSGETEKARPLLRKIILLAPGAPPAQRAATRLTSIEEASHESR